MMLLSTFLLLWSLMCCYGDVMHHLVLLEGLPPQFSLNSTPEVILTTNFSGSVDFKESNDFKVLLNISAPTIDDAYAVHAEIQESKGRLLVQVFEKHISASSISLTWIFSMIGAGAVVVAMAAIAYTVWWYCSKQHLEIQKDNFSHGNIMYRSRNSMHLSSTRAGESLILEDGEHGDDTLVGVPEEPEEEEAENRRMAEVRLSNHFDEDDDDDDNEDKRFIEPRYQSSSRKIHRDHREYVRQHSRRKRHPSLNDPPSYNTVMDYPNSDDSDGEGTTRKKQLEPLIEASATSIDKKSQKSLTYQESDVRLYRGVNQPILPVARSDGDLETKNSGRQYKPPYQIPQLGKLSSSKANSRGSVKNQEPTTPQETPKESPYATAEVYSRVDKNPVRDDTPGMVHMGTAVGPPVQPLVETKADTAGSNPMDIPLTSFTGSIQRQRSRSGRVRSTSLFIDPEAPEEKDVFVESCDDDDDDDNIFGTSPVSRPILDRVRHASGDSRTRHKSGERNRHPSGDRKFHVPPGSSPARVPNGNSPARSQNSNSPARYAEGGHVRHPNMDHRRNQAVDKLRYSMTSDSSVYGSSEIFKKKDSVDYYEDIDSDMDVEIPPLTESDADILSDVSLPLPSPPAFVKQNSADPRSPLRSFAYDEVPQNHTLPLSPFDFSGGTFITLAASPSNPYDTKHFVFPTAGTGETEPSDPGYAVPNLPTPPPPPPPQETSTEVSAGMLPPPPKLFRPPQKYSWERPSSSKNGGPEYSRVQKRDSVKRDAASGIQRSQSVQDKTSSKGLENGGQEVKKESTGRGGSIKRKNIPKQLHLTIVCSFCILSLISGVYSQMTVSAPQVHVTVYAPRNFLTQKIQVYFNKDKPAHVMDAPSTLQAYDIAHPKLENLNSSFCRDSPCPQGCDEDTGQCICKKGYSLDANNQCQDVNECRDGTFLCHKLAGCLNMRGSYYCVCSGPFYGDGKLCEECSAPCRNGTYEVRPCGDNQKKQCQDCTTSCAEGFFMYSKCGKYQDASCRMCQQKCSVSEYEYQRCTETRNRICKGRGELKPPVVSNNLIIEDRIDTYRENESTIHHREFPPHSYGRLVFSKGSGFYVEVAIKYLHPKPMFTPKDHSGQNELSSFQGKKEILKSYCPYPSPVKYRLYYETHKNVTYKEKISWGEKVIEPCETYVKHGQFPSSDVKGSIMCSEPGPVSSVFAINSEFTTSKTTWVEKSESCLNSNDACLNCTRNCARQMILQGGNCSVAERDNNRSPRLPECFTCCAQRDCSDVCQNYHDFECQTIRCKQGNLLEFKLKPVYNANGDFICHMKPLANQKLLEIEYTIKHYYDTLSTQNFSIYSNKKWQRTGKLMSNEHFIKVEVDSGLTKMPDIIEGSPGMRDVSVGKYPSKGSEVRTAYIAGNQALVRPVKPYMETMETFGDKNCDENALDNLMLATGSADSEPYHHLTSLRGKFRGNFTYVISNTSSQSLVKLSVSKYSSILHSLYPGATLKTGSLKGNITHNATHWNLNVTAEVTSCPGVLNINVTDPEYTALPLFQYDIQIKCPPVFSILFSVPNGDSPMSDKQFIISVKDNMKKYQLHVYRPSSSLLSKSARKSSTVQSKEAVAPAHFSIPFIVSVCGIVFLLLFVAIVAIVIKFGQPQGDVLRFHWCHLVLMIAYITFQFIYAVFVSMSVFSLIVLAVNSDTTTFLKNYQHQRSVKTAFSNLELDHLDRHLQIEIDRQNKIAAESKQQCQQKMMKVIGTFEQLKKLVEQEVRDEINVNSVKDLLTDHTRELLEKFTNNLSMFKERYQSFIRHTKKVFAANIQQTYHSVETSKWLAGSQFLHRSVKNFRDLINSPTKPFMEWLGIEQGLTQLSGDIEIPRPQTPRFDKVFHSGSRSSDSKNPSTTSNTKGERTIQKHNMWFFADEPVTYTSSRNQTVTHSDPHNTVEPEYSGYAVFVVVMVLVDIVWFLHRFLKSCGVARLLLFGYPIFVSIREKTNSRNPDGSTKRQSQLFKTGPAKTFKEFFIKVVSSMFIPKVIATVFVCLFIYLISVTTFHFVNRETFSYLGYYNNMDDLLKLNEDFVNNRIESHARKINMMEYPTYQELMNLHAQRHLFLYRTIESQWLSLLDAHRDFYCNYKKMLDPDVDCDNKMNSRFSEPPISACNFKQIQPKFYTKHSVRDSPVAEIQMDTFLTSIRKLISDTCYIVLIYMSIIVIKELLGTVVWLCLKRSGVINLRLIFEADKPPPTPRDR